MIEFVRDMFHQPFFVASMAIFACFCFYSIKAAQNTPFKKIIWIAYSGLAVITLLIFVVSAIHRYFDPKVWDFGAWHLYGKAAAHGYNYYSPGDFNTVFNSILHGMPLLDYSGFINQAVNVGFPYPPPTMLYFVTLGFFSYKAGSLIWISVITVFALIDILLIYSLFFKEWKWNGLLLVIILFSIFLPSLSTINFTQTNFFVLFYLLLMVKYQDRKFSGIMFTLAVFTKPYMAILGLFFILRKKWGALVYSIISAFMLIGFTLLLFGKDVFTAYLFDNPTYRAEAAVFSEDINQSLLAVLLRQKLITLDHPLAYIYIVSGVLLIMIIVLSFIMKKKLYNFILPILLLFGLLIYPGTLKHYGVILLFILFQFFNEKGELSFSPVWTTVIVGAGYYLSTISVFWCIVFLILLLVFKSIFAANQSKELKPERSL